jgi:hypothetical protein
MIVITKLNHNFKSLIINNCEQDFGDSPWYDRNLDEIVEFCASEILCDSD